MRNNEGRSVASMWGDMVADAERGEVVGIENKHGQTVAVMVSVAMFKELTGIDVTQVPEPPDAG